MWTSPLYRWRPDAAPPRPKPDRPASAAPDERIEVAAADGYPIRGGIWHADAGPVVVIHAATAVQARYYARFAAWLSGQGATVLTFDYRGIGESRSVPVKDLRAGWVDWGVLDAEAVLAHAGRRWPDRSLCAVGHLIGGFALGLARSAARLDRIVTVGAQFAYWRDYDPRRRRAMLLRWHLFMPAVTRLFGYFPGARLGWLEDVPRGLVRDWSRMGPRFETSVRSTLEPADLAARHGATRARLLAIGLTDDPFCTEAAGQRLLGYYSGADRTHLRIAPSELAVPGIGHFAFFHARFAQTLWPLAAAWLLSGRLPEKAPGRIVFPAG
ncbi:alpha/beta fold hydrolase [Cereibacter johrii]|uniref:alpha/beta hydrolase family protein n=1 Tax=Cereibacter johrii TaxID=445629 RepID=UPI002B260082|nr:alpha/beta hydrolase [Cereibacter johrii]MEA5161763.1 alpha/beta fold hydrolase [Cereibacter johrii]